MASTSKRPVKLPFLHRNWVTATNYLQTLGVKTESMSRKAAAEVEGRNERPAKRCRLEKDYDGFPPLCEYQLDGQRALRVEIVEISHVDSPRVRNGMLKGQIPPSVKDVSQSRARCKVSISTKKAGKQVILHVDSQVCLVKSYKMPLGCMPMARLDPIRPFHIPEDKIYLERDDDAVFGLADSYTITIELESAGDANWPPADLVRKEKEAAINRQPAGRHWVLAARISDIFRTRKRKTIRLFVKKSEDAEMDTMTDLLVHVDIRWFTPISSLAVMKRKQDRDLLACITAFHQDGPSHAAKEVGGVDSADLSGAAKGGPAGGRVGKTSNHTGTSTSNQVANGHTDILTDGQGGTGSPARGEEAADGDLTPNRSRRARQEINYNLRDMFNNVLGKGNREGRKAGDEPGYLDEHTITYLLPPEQVRVEGFSCLICGAAHQSIVQLRLHSESHGQYRFRWEARARGGHDAHVSAVPNSTAVPLRPRVYQLGLPTRRFDMEKYVKGDETWMRSRLGPDDDSECSIIGKSPQAKPAEKPGGQRSGKQVLVPYTKQPLYDPLSKAQLVPGTELRPPPVDEDWLILKHRDTLQDFVDVDESEKEYMMEWDAFLLRKHLSSGQYLQRHFLAFVREKASWVVAKPSRCDEFTKHVSVLLARSLLGDAAVYEAVQKINEARAQKMDMSPEPPKPWNAAGCVVCGEPVPVSKMAICSNKSCNRRLHHVGCIAGIPDAAAWASRKKGWRCGRCT